MEFIMKKIIYAFTLLFSFLLATNASAIDLPLKTTYEVGTQPLASFYSEDSQYVNIICAGNDVNFNGEFDEADGDEVPSWWRVEAHTTANGDFDLAETASKVMDLPWGTTMFPLRPGHNENTLIMGNNSQLLKLDLNEGTLETFEKMQDELDGNAIGGLAILDENNYFVGVRNPNATDTIYHTDAEFNILAKIPTGEDVGQLLPAQFGGGNFIVAICENYTGTASELYVYRQMGQNFTQLHKLEELGQTLNHVAMEGTILAMVFNGSHKVSTINLMNNIVVDIELPTSGWDGPREVVFKDQTTLWVSAYNSMMYEVDLGEQEVTDSLAFNGKPEGITYIKNSVMACYPYETGTYNYINKVEYFGRATSIEELVSIQNSKLYPNPVRDNATLEITFPEYVNENINVQISDISGKTLFTKNDLLVNSTDYKLNINASNFTNGIYYLNVNYKNYSKTISFVINK